MLIALGYSGAFPYGYDKVSGLLEFRVRGLRIEANERRVHVPGFRV